MLEVGNSLPFGRGETANDAAQSLKRCDSLGYYRSSLRDVCVVGSVVSVGLAWSRRASDGGDIGCRYTPEMIELCKVALDLRRRGILEF